MFQDSCTLYSVTTDKWGNDVPDNSAVMPCTFVQRTDIVHANFRDTITADSFLYLPVNDFTSDNFYRLEGMRTIVNPFGNSDSQQYFKITSVTAARDVLLDNQVEHIECGLAKIGAFDYVS